MYNNKYYYYLYCHGSLGTRSEESGDFTINNTFNSNPGNKEHRNRHTLNDI